MKKIHLSIISGFLILSLSTTVFAEILGNITGGFAENMGAGTEFFHNIYNEGSSNVQREYYMRYSPNEESVPVVVNGEQIYGKRTIMQAVSYMNQSNMRPLIGINADYFSFKTGVPMGHTIIDNELVTKDTTGQNAIGFNDDGTGFISWLEIQSTITRESGESMMLDCINKWCQPTISASYLLTRMFGESTKTEGSCKYIIFSPVEGKCKIGDKMTLRVDEKFDYDNAIAIPDGKYVLTMTNTYGDTSKLAFMDSLNIGETVTLMNEAVYDKDKWNGAKNGISSVGERLIENGVTNTNFAVGSAPRTAVGIAADGTLIFYVIDGRQKNFSVGISIKSLAARMAELGCVDAINLDGGGSSAIAGIYPGSSDISLINKPSEGALRSCANYIFLQDLRKPTGIGKYFDVYYDQNRNFLSGATEQLGVGKVYDTSNYYIENPQIKYSVINSDGTNASITDLGFVNVSGSGEVIATVNVSGGTKDISYNVYDTPEQIEISAWNGVKVDSLTYTQNDNYTVDLSVSAYVNGVKLNSSDNCFKWSCDESIGTIDQNGYFVPNTSIPNTGEITVRAGELSIVIPVTIFKKSTFADTTEHWAKFYAENLYDNGIVTGETTDNGLIFRPDSTITRGEFSVLICRYLDETLGSYPKNTFSDSSSIPEWLSQYVDIAEGVGFINGKQTQNGIEFRPFDLLTRAEAIAIIGRIFENENYSFDTEFSDIKDVPDYAKESVKKLCAFGIINGYDDSTLRPNESVKRGESAKMIYSLIEAKNK